MKDFVHGVPLHPAVYAAIFIGCSFLFSAPRPTWIFQVTVGAERLRCMEIFSIPGFSRTGDSGFHDTCLRYTKRDTVVAKR